jgi:hypothetical protein
MLYAGLRVIDPNTNLPKYVLINWVCILLAFMFKQPFLFTNEVLTKNVIPVLKTGEGVPSSRKGTCANHVRDVERFFRV